MFTQNIDFNNLQVINFTEDISHQCAAGVAYETPCYKGLAYNPEIHVCDYPDSVRCLRCFQTLLCFHLSRAPEEPFSLQHSASRCRTVRNNLKESLGSNALRWLWYCFFFLTKLFTISQCFSSEYLIALYMPPLPHRPMSFPPMLSPGASFPSQGDL